MLVAEDGRVRVLIVEDELRMASLIRRGLVWGTRSRFTRRRGIRGGVRRVGLGAFAGEDGVEVAVAVAVACAVRRVEGLSALERRFD